MNMVAPLAAAVIYAPAATTAVAGAIRGGQAAMQNPGIRQSFNTLGTRIERINHTVGTAFNRAVNWAGREPAGLSRTLESSVSMGNDALRLIRRNRDPIVAGVTAGATFAGEALAEGRDAISDIPERSGEFLGTSVKHLSEAWNNATEFGHTIGSEIERWEEGLKQGLMTQVSP